MKDNAFPLFAALLILGFSGLLLGHLATKTQIQREAILAGVAYYTNDANGTAQFKCKEAKP